MVCSPCAVSKKTSGKPAKNDRIRATITIPNELEKFVERQKAHPLHSGNLSSYLRALIVGDMERKAQREEVAA